jgi:DNA-directed RNA polymerase sigma subunit (sigma70/sigma32)
MKSLPFQRGQSVAHIQRQLLPCSLLTQAEVGELLQITRNRVGQIEREAIWKVQQRLNELLKGDV